MAELNLTGQETITAPIRTRITQLRNALEERKAVWQKLPLEKKRAWVQSGKDPIMTLAWQVYRYLRDNFFGDEVDNG